MFSADENELIECAGDDAVCLYPIAH